VCNPDQSCKSGRAFRVGPGSGLILSKCFGPAYNNIQSNYFFFRDRFVVLTVVSFVSAVIVIFLQLILLANTAAFFCSLLGLVSHSFSEGDSGEEITML